MYKNVKRHSYIREYIYTFIYKITRLLPISFGSIDIKEVRTEFE